MSRCIKLTKRQALKLLDWHGGQGTSAYALGSSSFAGRCSTVETARDVMDDLRTIRSSERSARNRRQLTYLIGAIWKRVTK